MNAPPPKLEPDMLLAALDLAEQGFAVFPLKPGDKTPITPHGCNDASTDPEQIRAWWSKRPDANVGIATEGLLVVDIDGDAGRTTLTLLQAGSGHGDLPPTKASLTGKGEHLLFRRPEGGERIKSSTGDGLDVRADGGYIVAPPSLHPNGKRYAWAAFPTEMAEAPAWLIDWARSRKSGGRQNGAPARHAPAGRLSGISSRVASGRADEFLSWSAETSSDLDNLLAHIDGEDRESWHCVLAVFTSWTIVAPELEPTLREKFDEWSMRWPEKFDPEDQEKQWRDGLKRAADRRAKGEALLGYGTLVRMAGGRAACPSPTADAPPPIEPCHDVDPTRFRWSDAGNALLFVELFKENIRYIEKWKAWIIWDGRRWVEASDIAMLPLARAATEHMFNWAAKLPEERREGLRKHALNTQKGARLTEMLHLAKGEQTVRVEPSALDSDPMLLGCLNGTLDLRTGELREPRREDYITKSIAVDYDPRADCPNFMNFLSVVAQGDEETMEHLQRVAGYCFTGDVSEEKLFSLFGAGGNGKTTLVMALLELMGDYGAKARKDLLLQSQGEKGAASPDVAALHGKRLVVVSETDDGCTLAEAQVKEITSNERIAARRLHKDPFEFMPTHKIALLTNNPPFVKGTDDGIWRRLNIIPFDVKIDEAQKEADFRAKKLRPEQSGILRWAVEGCLKWQYDGLKPSQAVRRATEGYRENMDLVGQWLDERCERDTAVLTPRAVAYDDYKKWAAREHVQHTLGPRRFGDELCKRGFERAQSNGARGFRGLSIKAPLPISMKIGG